MYYLCIFSLQEKLETAIGFLKVARLLSESVSVCLRSTVKHDFCLELQLFFGCKL